MRFGLKALTLFCKNACPWRGDPASHFSTRARKTSKAQIIRARAGIYF